MRLAQSLFALACLPYEAYFSLGAIARTAWRMLVSHKHLLEWAPSDDQDRKAHAGLVASFLSMWISAFLAV
jgi:hypothetical protein